MSCMMANWTLCEASLQERLSGGWMIRAHTRATPVSQPFSVSQHTHTHTLSQRMHCVVVFIAFILVASGHGNTRYELVFNLYKRSARA